MKTTLNDIAKQAGVSIATVSHVINRTRYVSPEVFQKVEDAIKSTGYIEKIAGKECRLQAGKMSEVAFVVPRLKDTIYAHICSILAKELENEGLLLSIFLSMDDSIREKHILNALMSNKRFAGIVLSPVSDKASDYAKFLSSEMPILFVGRTVHDTKADCITYEYNKGIYLGATHLIKRGHENIALLLDDKDSTVTEECLAGYRRALFENKLKYNENMIFRLDLYQEKKCEQIICNLCTNDLPSAFLTKENKITLILLKILQNLGLECPKDVSVVGFGDESWCSLIASPLTMVQQSSEKMGKLVAEQIVNKIHKKIIPHLTQIPVTLSIRKSTQMVGRGPFGEKAISPDELSLSKEEIEQLRAKKYRVGISFHYSGTAWTRLHENAIRDTLEKIGVAVVGVFDAHFDPELQVTQLEGLRIQKPDAIIAIPADDMITSKKFKEISKETKLVFISGVPEGMKKNEYASCISVNERENGQNAGILLGEYFKKRGGKAKIAFINHGAPFYGTHLRDMVAEQVIREDYPQIEIIQTGYFYKIDHAYEVCKQMIYAHPEIEGLYISWERPALEAIRALKELHREDIVIVSCDLDLEIAKYLARNEMVMGLSTQRPYEQGVAVALATAKALLGKTGYKYIGVPACTVQAENLVRSWKEIIHEPIPEELEKDLQKNLRNKFDI